MASTHSGACRKCERVVGKAQMTRHLKRCLGENTVKGQFLILVEWPRSPYWVYFTAPKNITLRRIDAVLRAMWVECCDHLSAFFADKVTFADDPEPTLAWGLGERPLSMTLKRALPENAELRYEYDFGSTTELKLRVLDDRIAGLGPDITVVARNQAPEVECVNCGQSATMLKMDDWYPKPYCENCLGEEEEMQLPLINSPRTGVCEYTGPSIEP